MMRSERMSRKGFTLVELLVSITLTIFILSLFATLFGAGNDAVRAARGSGEIDRSVQASITKIKRDLEHVYIGDGVKLSEAFTSPTSIPNAGYFTIEENLPASPPYYVQDATQAANVTSPAHDPNFAARVQAINARLQLAPPPGYSGPAQPAVGYRQGIDDRGVPLEIDTDDVLAFTARLSGDNASEIFYGRVPVGSVLDNDLDPGSRFDAPNNGQFTSPTAEICYFLRADRPYSLAEINRPALGSDEGRLAQAATFTLYRRELLVLSESQRNKVEERLNSVSALADIQQVVSTTLGQNRNPSLYPVPNPNYNPSLYQNYDVAFRFDPLSNVVRFNDVVALRLRQNRYGMQWVASTAPFPDGRVVPRVLNPQFSAPFYDHDPSAASLTMRMHVPGRTYPAGVRPLFRGRPTLFESTIVGYQGYANANNLDYDPSVASSHASWNFANPNLRFDEQTTPFVSSSARRGNADVLLTNVLSFDVKVLNDDVLLGYTSFPLRSDESVASVGLEFPEDLDQSTFFPRTPGTTVSGDASDWPANRTSLLRRINPSDNGFNGSPADRSTYSRTGPLSTNTSRLRGIAVPAMIQSDFVDIGFTLVRELNAGWGSTFPNEARCVISNNIRSLLPLSFINTRAHSVQWGQQTPARWMSTGRSEAWLNIQHATIAEPIASVYDTWSPDYNAETFATEFLTPLPTPRPTKYLPPYDRPIRGIQITIRTLEPRSGLVREFQIIHRF
jgi:type II secretory pathway pseudopilin PulG